MSGFFSNMGEELTPIVKAALKEVEDFFGSNGMDSLMRRFRSQYDTLTLEQIAAIHQALGHQDDEENPCKACKIMAAEEVRLSKEE